MGIETEKVDLESQDLAAAKRAAFEELFPGVLSDGVLDATRLGELLDTEVTAPASGPERFGLMWAGKQDALRSLLMPTRGTLVPDTEGSIKSEVARHIFIEGDNLEVLKLLQKPYNDRIKLVYIDPPYNTGNDFVYNDDFEDGLEAYLTYTGQIDNSGNRISASVDTGGRRHSRWLSMMYPRLLLARNLLTEDGVLLCSINDVELANLLSLLKEIFGEENFLATFIWHNDGNIEQQSRIKVNHEYIVAFARNEKLVPRPTVIDPNIDESSKLFKAEVENTITKTGPANPPSTVTLPRGFPASSAEFEVDPRQDALPHILDRIVVRDGQLVEPVRLRSGWSSRRLLDLFIENRFVPIEDAKGKELRFAITPTGAIYGYKARGADRGHVLTVLRNMGRTQASSAWLKKEWGVFFDYPKPEKLIQHLVATFTSQDDLIFDFFAGSGTTMHAVTLENASDEGHRRSISVTLPEPVPPDSVAGKAGFRTVSEIARLRLTKVIETVPGAASDGLKTFALRKSNFRVTPDELTQIDLTESTAAHGEADFDAIAAEILLMEGVTLDTPWERAKCGGAPTVSAGNVTVVLSFAITDEIVREALALTSRVVVFLEDGFAAADAVKANAVTNARSLGISLKTV